MARTKGSDGKETEAKVFAAARALFAAKGYGAVGMRDVADAVGIRVGGLYRYVPDKESLLTSITDSHMSARRAACPPPNGEPLRDLDAFVEAQQGALEADAEGAVITARDRLWLPVAALSRIAHLEGEIIAHLSAILNEGRKSVFQLPDAQAGAVAIMSVLQAFALPDGEKARLGEARAKRISANFARRIAKA